MKAPKPKRWHAPHSTEPGRAACRAAVAPTGTPAPADDETVCYDCGRARIAYARWQQSLKRSGPPRFVWPAHGDEPAGEILASELANGERPGAAVLLNAAVKAGRVKIPRRPADATDALAILDEVTQGVENERQSFENRHKGI